MTGQELRGLTDEYGNGLAMEMKDTVRESERGPAFEWDIRSWTVGAYIASIDGR